MPLERISKGFNDISMTFEVNPLNRDLITLKNENAIARSIRNLILTSPGERFFNENLGSYVSKSLFENLDEIYTSVIASQVESTINRYEPRVKLKDVKVTLDYDNGEYNISITYEIIGIDASSQILTFALQPTR